MRVFARRQIFINLDRFEHEEGAEEATDETFFGRKKTMYVYCRYRKIAKIPRPLL